VAVSREDDHVRERAEPSVSASLPEPVRRRVVDVAADRLGAMDAADVPARLRPFARFTPARRREAVLPIALAVDTDEDFRAAVADGVREALPDLVAALEAGQDLPAADPDDVAAVAYLLRTPGWERNVAAAAERAVAAEAAAAAESAQRSERAAQRSADAEVDAARAQVEALRAQLAVTAADVERERARAKAAGERARKAEAALAEVTAAVEEERQTWSRDEAAYAKEVGDLRLALAEAQASVDRLRRDTRDARDAADSRRWLLLDTLSRAVSGLRDELSPGAPTRRPADFVAAVEPAAEGAGGLGSGALGPAPEDPASVDVLLALPNAHLIVDGYNVTKTGFPDLPLADQRNRLIAGLSALAARTGAEVTCVFDGAEVAVRVPVAGARRVRVRFSPPGQIADELIRRLVRAEPAGRPVTVCSADNEVIDGVRRAGARVVLPTALLTRLRA
jgi:predicted RNA-binding protein with PIN domain